MEAVSRRYGNEAEYDDLSSFARVELHPHLEAAQLEPPKPGYWRCPPPPSEERRSIRPTVSWILGWIIVAGALFALVLGAMAQASQGASSDQLGPWYLAIALLAIGSMLGLLAHVGGGSVAPDSVARLASERGLERGLPVRVSIRADGSEVGSDDGIARFEHGLLRFVGLSTEFAIGTQDIRFVSSCASVQPPFVSMESSPRIALRHPEKLVELCFHPWSRLTRDDQRDCVYRFAHELRRFLHAWRPGSGERRWPPLEPQPGRVGADTRPS
ncbi:MAG: hypothetical protein N2109_09520 [Fimbriimonadales bacterium]|nr:hypothetical protein [Fimbriimonadales bacterium]